MQKKQKKQKNISRGLSLPQEMWADIDRRADLDRRNPNNFLRVLIEKELENPVKK